MLEQACDDVYMLSGVVSKKDRKTTLQEVRNSKSRYILLATSKLLGEGFDLPSLNCLFLVLPISSETRITQYTGRIHRSFEGKDIVKVYDYVDAQIPMAQAMYYKRLKQYQKEGYFVNTPGHEETVDRILFEREAFEEAIRRDITDAAREIVIFSVSLHSNKVHKWTKMLQNAAQQGVDVHLILSASRTYSNESTAYLQGHGVVIRYASHSKHFIIIDRNIVWNCSFDMFGSMKEESFATRDENKKAAEEVISSINGDRGEITKNDLFDFEIMK
jgi:superfamily II DNA or RNA helicase